MLWRKLPGARSAGRVQSVALRLVCDREAEIEAFRTDEYWTSRPCWRRPRARSSRPASTPSTARRSKKLDIKDGDDSQRHQGAPSRRANSSVVSVEKKAVKRNPYAPFATSTLQMDASRKLGFSAKQTMQVAQRLYEGVDIGGETVGLITYMRTDGVTIVPEAISAIRGLIAREYSQKFVAPFIREYKTKAKNAQEAHEAIRPTEVSPQAVGRRQVSRERSGAALRADLEARRRQPDGLGRGRADDGRHRGQGPRRQGLHAARHRLGRPVRRLPQGLRGRPRRPRTHAKRARTIVQDDETDRRLPALPQGDKVTDRAIEAEQHFTQPPPRYSEATLVKKMEELGIGRPSTYASTLAVLQEREYVRIDKKRLIPEDKGRLVIAFLESFFKRYVEYDFTADLEEKLDLISDGKLEWKDVCATSGGSSPARSTRSRICASARCWKR